MEIGGISINFLELKSQFETYDLEKIFEGLQLDNIPSLPSAPDSKSGVKWIKLPFLGKFLREIGRTLHSFGRIFILTV